MSEVLATWDDFAGGHWGSLGPRAAAKTQWGGINMLLTKTGGLTPVCASRILPLDTQRLGKVWDEFWGWGADGKIYYVQTTTTVTAIVYSFTPTTTGTNNTTNVGSITIPTTKPDWVAVGTTIYLTVFGDKTYAISTGGSTLAVLTGSYGAAAAGRCICIYGERLMVGGVNDARFGNHPDRIHFSGDDSAVTPDPSDRTAWETANYFDVGDGTPIVALKPTRDALYIVMQDQQIWVATGVPGSTLSLRRAQGFQNGSGSIEALTASHVATDPSQTRLWMFDHTVRGPARFNGAQLQRQPGIGFPNSDRTGTSVVEGALAMIGGPDEFVMDGVQMPRGVGEQVIGHRVELIRLNGVNQFMLIAIIAAR